MNRADRRRNKKAFEKDKHIRIKKNRYKVKKSLEGGKKAEDIGLTIEK